MFIVDTTIWIDLLNGTATRHTTWLKQQMPSQRICLTDLILCEVLQGYRTDEAFLAVQLDLAKFEILETGSASIAIASASNYRFLRARGITIRKTIDCLIATYCISRQLPLLHNDRDFDPFETHLGLQVIHP